MNASAARKARDNGIARAVEHADDVSSGWSEHAYRLLCIYVSNIKRGVRANGPKSSTFSAENLRSYAYSAGLSVPPDERAWGAVLIRASKESIIHKLGYKQATGRACHMHPVTLWQVVG